jgi:hypothetical protein
MDAFGFIFIEQFRHKTFGIIPAVLISILIYIFNNKCLLFILVVATVHVTT